MNHKDYVIVVHTIQSRDWYKFCLQEFGENDNITQQALGAYKRMKDVAHAYFNEKENGNEK